MSTGSRPYTIFSFRFIDALIVRLSGVIDSLHVISRRNVASWCKQIHHRSSLLNCCLIISRLHHPRLHRICARAFGLFRIFKLFLPIFVLFSLSVRQATTRLELPAIDISLALSRHLNPYLAGRAPSKTPTSFLIRSRRPPPYHD